MEFDIKIEVKLNPAWKQVEPMLEKVAQIAARNIEKRAKHDVPFDTGDTKNSIEAREAGKLAWRIGPTTHYAPHLEFGTVKMRARPYLVPNAEIERPKFVKAVEQITKDL